MKTFLIAASFLFLSSAFAEEVKVSSMKRVPGMDRAFKLKTSLPDPVVLDCQSFIQGLTLGESFIMMDAQECETLALNMKASFKKFQKHCIEIDDRIEGDYTCP